MILGTGQPSNLRRSDRRGFSLIEMVLVLALLVVAVSMVSPKLGGFIRARALEAEARRILALTHAARSRAISEGMTMILWLDTSNGRYGVERETPGKNGDANSLEFSTDPGIQVSFTTVNRLIGQTPNSPKKVKLPGVKPQNQRNMPAIRMLPDGSVDEDSPEAIQLVDEVGGSLWIVEGSDRRHYEVRTSTP